MLLEGITIHSQTYAEDKVFQDISEYFIIGMQPKKKQNSIGNLSSRKTILCNKHKQ